MKISHSLSVHWVSGDPNRRAERRMLCLRLAGDLSAIVAVAQAKWKVRWVKRIKRRQACRASHA